jgi:hypothetical protein
VVEKKEKIRHYFQGRLSGRGYGKPLKNKTHVKLVFTTSYN